MLLVVIIANTKCVYRLSPGKVARRLSCNVFRSPLKKEAKVAYDVFKSKVIQRGSVPLMFPREC